MRLDNPKHFFFPGMYCIFILKSYTLDQQVPNQMTKNINFL